MMNLSYCWLGCYWSPIGCTDVPLYPEDQLSCPLCYQTDISQSPAECYQSSAGNGCPFISALAPHTHSPITPHTQPSCTHTHMLTHIQGSLNFTFVYLLKTFYKFFLPLSNSHIVPVPFLLPALCSKDLLSPKDLVSP